MGGRAARGTCSHRQHGPPDDSPQPGQQFARREGFRYVIVGAELQAGDAVRRLAAPGEHQNRHRGFCADPPEHLKPVQTRQHDIEKDSVEIALQRLVQPVGPGVGQRHFIAERFKILLHHAAEFRIVIHDEQSRAGRGWELPGNAVHGPLHDNPLPADCRRSLPLLYDWRAGRAPAPTARPAAWRAARCGPRCGPRGCSR